MPSTSETFFSGIVATKTDTTAINIRPYGAVALTVVGTGSAVATAEVYGVDGGRNNVLLETLTFTVADEQGLNLTWVGYGEVNVHITAYTTGTFAAYLDAR